MAATLQVGWEPGIVTSALLAVLGSFVTLGIFRRVFGTDRTIGLPPGPPRIPFPLNLVTSFLFPENRMRQLTTIHKKYGDIVTVQISGQPKILVGSPELVREIFLKLGEVTSNRVTLKVLKYTLGYTGGITFSHGDTWHTLRKFSLSALRSFGMGKSSMEHKITQEAAMLSDALWQSHQQAEGSGVNPADFLNNAVSNVICSLTFGHRFEYDDPEFVDMVQRVKIIIGGSPPEILRLLFQRFPNLFLSPLFKSKRETFQGLKDFLERQVQAHEETFEAGDVRDIIDVFLAENRRLQTTRSDEEMYFKKEDIWTFVFDLFIAGTETTSSALIWFFLIMAGHKYVQAQVIREIDSTIGQERAPRYEDRKSMPYTEATLTEVLRYRPVAAMTIPHITSEDVRVRDYTLPKGSEVWLNIVGIHHDPEVFPAPDKFDPTRFLSADGQTFVKHEAFYPFGVGRRSCLGEQLAKMEFFLFATSILQRYHISMAPGTSPDYDISHRIRTLLPKDFNVCLTKR